ncbi:oxysterol-binding protein 1-like [Rhopilema esculentum]|uniref:oxysterol-binding protein 1-like n=1 Tax=Rhopilema esculentum TaxID=499914 RepID=UPI0031D46BDA
MVIGSSGKDKMAAANTATGPRSDFNLVDLKSDALKTSWRTTLPASRDKYNFSLFGFLRSTIGKDLTRITMPVHFNEPLSFLQRLTEDLEYADVLNKAAECETTIERLAYVAAFASSVYANVPGRFWKPFNPLLGETFEFLNKEQGYAVVCEQVSHHPPVSALHAESDKWVFWEEYQLDTRFRGLYVKIVPTGTVHVIFKKDNAHYSWKKPETRIHNIVIGTLYVDHDGLSEIVSHNTGEKATVKFTPYRKSHSYKKLTGEVKDKNGIAQLTLEGAWDEGLIARPTNGCQISERKLWTAIPKPDDSHRVYGFTKFAFCLNEADESINCPTDSRRRPDQRLLEFAKVEEAASEKHRLEEKQRHARKAREHRKETWKPRWFVSEVDADTGTVSHVYNGGYWTAKVNNGFDENAPDIF